MVLWWHQGTELINLLDAGAVEQVCIELSLGHVTSVLLDKVLNSVLPSNMWWLVGVCLKPFPPED